MWFSQMYLYFATLIETVEQLYLELLEHGTCFTHYFLGEGHVLIVTIVCDY